MKDHFKGLITSETLLDRVAQLVKEDEVPVSLRRIQQLAPNLISMGLAKKFNRTVVFHESAAQQPMLRKKK